MLLWRDQRHPGIDLRDGLFRLACDNRASAQQLPRFGTFPVFPELRPKPIKKSQKPLHARFSSLLEGDLNPLGGFCLEPAL